MSAALVCTLSAAANAAVAETAAGNSGPPLLGDPLTPDRPIAQFQGDVNAFYGKINPFYGKINPFYGDISPFWGDNTQFWGDVTNPFSGASDPSYGAYNSFWGTLTPFSGPRATLWKQIDPFWQTAGPQWGSINALWTQLQSANATDYSNLQAQFQNFLASAAAFWGPTVQKANKSGFWTGFADPLLAKYGIDPNDPTSLANASAETRSEFFLAWYDGLMSYTGVDHVDWWMGAIHWSPALTQIQGQGSQSVIGVLDSYFTSNNSDVDNLHFAGGYKYNVNDHGAAVASLIAAKPDGQSVMGIAPNSDIELYNPFDSTGTASWTDVTNGILTLHAKGAFVINASLGVPGWTLSDEWANILTSPAIANSKNQIVLVKAAGNEGVTQTSNVTWIGAQAPTNLIVVGSVDPNGQISTFSNTPGEACITINGVCNEANKLKYRFIVAPGENILVSDNHGGVTRMTGTSFAAPLVTGAVALLQDRWPWLQQHADETVQIILQSATDLGAPGVDPVYGWGELNVEAAQSPLSFDNLVVYQPTQDPKGAPPPGIPVPPGNAPPGTLPNFKGTKWTTAALKSSLLNPGQLNLWQKQGAYLVAFEPIGTTYRDFEMPLSTLLVGQSLKGPGAVRFQTYLYDRLITWANGGQQSFDSGERTIALDGDAWTFHLETEPLASDQTHSNGLNFNSEVVAFNPSTGIGLNFGQGSGARSLSIGSAFGDMADFDPATGGVNPVLGLASGGAFAAGSLTLGDVGRVHVGFTQKNDDHIVIDPTFGLLQTEALSPNKAQASTVGFDTQPLFGVSFNASYTALDEADGLLGAQGSGLFSFSGARTDGVTLGTTVALPEGFALAGSATSARTSGVMFGTTALSLANDTLQSTAYEFAASKTAIFGETDKLRLSFAQPLHVNNGALQYQSLQVVDRTTGQLGALSQTWSLSGAAEHRVETMYQLPLLGGRAEIDGYGLVDLDPPVLGRHAMSLSFGAQARIDL
ncbi:MAG TPA: S8 family peptidase [Rhizomicrobium sp.]